MPWWAWVAVGAALTIVGVVLVGHALLSDYSRPFVARLVGGVALVCVGAAVGTLPIGFPESTGAPSAFQSTEGCW